MLEDDITKTLLRRHLPMFVLSAVAGLATLALIVFGSLTVVDLRGAKLWLAMGYWLVAVAVVAVDFVVVKSRGKRQEPPRPTAELTAWNAWLARITTVPLVVLATAFMVKSGFSVFAVAALASAGWVALDLSTWVTRRFQRDRLRMLRVAVKSKYFPEI